MECIVFTPTPSRNDVHQARHTDSNGPRLCAGRFCFARCHDHDGRTRGCHVWNPAGGGIRRLKRSRQGLQRLDGHRSGSLPRVLNDAEVKRCREMAAASLSREAIGAVFETDARDLVSICDFQSLQITVAYTVAGESSDLARPGQRRILAARDKPCGAVSIHGVGNQPAPPGKARRRRLTKPRFSFAPGRA